MISIKADLDSERLKDAVELFKFVGGNTRLAQQVAINKTVPIARTRASQKIGETVNLTAKYIKGKLQFEKANKFRLSGRVFAPGEGVLLSRYEHGAKVSLLGGLLTPPNPIRVKVNKGAGQIQTVDGGPDTYGKPFLFRLKNAREGGIKYGIGGWRITPGPRGGRFKAFYGPSVSQVFTKVKDTITPEISEVYINQLIDAMRFVLQRKYPSE